MDMYYDPTPSKAEAMAALRIIECENRRRKAMSNSERRANEKRKTIERHNARLRKQLGIG